jgi:hypothetical protein
MRQVIKLLVLPIALLSYFHIAAAVENENEVSFESYIANFNAFPSDFLDVKIAKAVNIKRGASRGVVTIAVRKHVEGAADKSVKAEVNGTATSTLGTINKLNFSQVRDGDVLYYLGTFTFAHYQSITFNVNILPEGELQPYKLTFTRQF